MADKTCLIFCFLFQNINNIFILILQNYSNIVSMLTRSVYCFLLSFILNVQLIAQPPAVELLRVQEQRSSSQPGSVTFTLKVNDFQNGVKQLIKFDTLYMLLDNEDNVIHPQYKYTHWENYSYKTEAKLSVTMTNTVPRNVSQINEIRGTIKLFEPAESNKSKFRIKVKDLAYNQNILQGFNGEVSVVPFRGKELQDLASSDPKAYRQEVLSIFKAASPKVKLAKKLEILTEFSRDKNGTESFYPEARTDGYSFFIFDPQNKLVAIELVDPKGKPYPVYTEKRDVYQYVGHTPAKVDPGAYFEIIVETKSALKVIPFELKNVALP